MVQAHRIKTVALLGCTAVGKSAAALKLAERFNGELIGADSMQIYRGFDIGTGKLTEAECGGITHRLIDIVDGDAEFSVGEYVELAKRAIEEGAARGKLPIIVGGTGLYVYSLLSGCNFADAPRNDGVRNALKADSHFLGAAVMHALLEKVDRRSADGIAVNDVKRTVRALEIFAVGGAPKSAAAVKAEPPFDALTIVLTLPRELLYSRIDARVKKMFDDGLEDEVRSLMQYKDCGSMQALGYKQIAEAPTAPRSVTEPLVAQKTRNYAKRQTTYFKNMKLDKQFIDARDYAELFSRVSAFLEEGK